LTLSAFVGAVLVGVAGARWLTNEVDKSLLRTTAVEAASSAGNPRLAERIALASPAGALRAATEIASMREGEVGYIVPWALSVDDKGRYWVRGDYNVFREPGGTVSVRISRRGDTIVVTRATVGMEDINIGKLHPAWLPMEVILE
jgi:hypothetical protein